MSRVCARAAAIAALALSMLATGASASGSFVQPVHVLHTFHGPTTGKGAFFGWAVSELRDVNGDGVTDVVVGEVDGGPKHRGRVWVYSGRTGKLLFRRHGRAGEQNGYAIADAGDVNGDGVPDLIVGASGTSAGHGAVYVYSGRTGRLLFRIHGERGNAAFGQFFVAGVGDVNGDGIPDVYVGDYASSNAGQAGGFAAVYSGADGALLHAWRGAAGQGLGPGRSAGDVNGDGVPDIVVGSYTSSDGAPGAGKVQIFSGATGRRLRTITSTTAGENLGFDAVGIGDTNGNGTPDLLVSAASLDTVYVIDGAPPA
jgi:FG-GAP-like repeat